MWNLISKFDPRKRSELFRKSFRNASFNFAEYIVLVILTLITTPLFVHKLGTDKYGIWMLVNSIVGFIGVMEFGLGAATVKYVSAHLAKKNIEGVVRVIRSTLTMYGIFGAFTAIIIYFLAPILINHVFNVGAENISLAIKAIQIAGFGMAIHMIDSVFLSVLQGHQRYDLTSKITMITKVVIMTVNVILVLSGQTVTQILLATITITALSSTVKAIVAKKILLPSLIFMPIFDRKALREIFGFGFYSWLQSISGILLNQVDKFIIVSFLDTTALTYYTVCLTLASQIHGVLSKTVSFLFPLSSEAHEKGNIEQMRRIYFKAMNFVTIAGIAMGLTIFLFSHNILSLWMGVDFADESANILRILSFAYTIMATSIVPYYFMNGTKFVKLNTLFAFISGSIIAISAVLMIPFYGVIGAAFARLASTPTGVISRTIVHYKVLGDRRIYAGLAIIFPIIVSFGIALIASILFGYIHIDHITRVLFNLVIVILGISISVVITYKLNIPSVTV